MKKYLLALTSLLVTASTVVSLSSCDFAAIFGGDKEKPHEHTYSEAWTSDETGHWHEASCDDGEDCKSAVNEKADHTLGDDGVCTVCGYKPVSEDPPKEDPPAEPAEGSAEKPISVTVPSSFSVECEKDQTVWYVFTAAEDGEISIAVSENGYIAYGEDQDELVYTDDKYVELDVVAGSTYYVNISTADLSAGTVEVSIAPVEVIEDASLTGRYVGASGNGNIFITIIADDDNLGGTVTFAKTMSGEHSATFTYTFIDDVISIYNANGVCVSDKTDLTRITLTYSNGTITEAFYDGYARTVSPLEYTGFEGKYDLSYENSKISVVIDAKSVTINATNASTGMPILVVINYTVKNGKLVLDSADTDVSDYGIVLNFDAERLLSVMWLENEYTIVEDEPPALEPNGKEENPYPIEFPSTVLADPDSEHMIWYTFTSDVTGILTVKYPNTNSWAFLEAVGVEQQTGYMKDELTFEVQAGVSYKLGLGTWSEEAEELSVEVSFNAQALSQPGDFDKPISVSAYGYTNADFPEGADAEKFMWFVYDPWGDGTATFKFNISVNVKYGFDPENFESASSLTELAVSVISGHTYYIGVQTQDLAAAKISFSVKYKEAEGTTADKPIAITVADGTSGKLNINGHSYNQFWYSFDAAADGYLTITYPDTNSSIALLLVGGEQIYLDSKDTYKLIIYAGNTYKIGLGVNNPGNSDFEADYSFEATAVPYPGDFGNPYKVDSWSPNVKDFAATDDQNKFIWFTYTPYNKGDVTFSFDSNVNVKFGTSEQTLESVLNNSKFTFKVEKNVAYYIGIQTADLSAATLTFEVSFKSAPGTDYDNPIEVVLGGDNSYDLPADSEGYFVFKPVADGTLTITVSSSNPDAWVGYYNENWEHIVIKAGETGQIPVTAGKLLDLTLSTYNENSDEIPGAADISFSASFVTSEGEPLPDGVLFLGTTSVTVAEGGKEYTYTAKLEGTYAIYFNSEVAKLQVKKSDGTLKDIESGYKFTLISGESVVFVMFSAIDAESTAYNVSISEKKETEDDTNSLVLGSQTVEASYDGIEYVFTAETSGTYTISFTSANAYVMMQDATGGSAIESGHEFTLAAGESASFAMCTDNNPPEDSYEIVIA